MKDHILLGVQQAKFSVIKYTIERIISLALRACTEQVAVAKHSHEFQNQPLYLHSEIYICYVHIEINVGTLL